MVDGRQGVMWAPVLADEARIVRAAVDLDLRTAAEAGVPLEAHSTLIALLRDTADRLDMIRQDPSAKAGYALVALQRTLTETYTTLGLAPDRSGVGGDALDRLLEHFADGGQRIP